MKLIEFIKKCQNHWTLMGILSDLKLLKGGEDKGECGEKNDAKADEGKYLNNKYVVRKP
jgi:hypothetical protein